MSQISQERFRIVLPSDTDDQDLAGRIIYFIELFFSANTIFGNATEFSEDKPGGGTLHGIRVVANPAILENINWSDHMADLLEYVRNRADVKISIEPEAA